jgi:hypothetical protein
MNEKKGRRGAREDWEIGLFISSKKLTLGEISGGEKVAVNTNATEVARRDGGAMRGRALPKKGKAAPLSARVEPARPARARGPTLAQEHRGLQGVYRGPAQLPGPIDLLLLPFV